MRPCESCNNAHRCRVPRDMAVMERVMRRVGDQDSSSPLFRRLRHYVETDLCLVDAGIAR